MCAPSRVGLSVQLFCTTALMFSPPVGPHSHPGTRTPTRPASGWRRGFAGPGVRGASAWHPPRAHGGPIIMLGSDLKSEGRGDSAWHPLRCLVVFVSGSPARSFVGFPGALLFAVSWSGVVVFRGVCLARFSPPFLIVRWGEGAPLHARSPSTRRYTWTRSRSRGR